MSLLDRIFKRFTTEPTQQEKDDAALNKRQCPDCGSKNLIVGPQGGAGFDLACIDCRSEFVVVSFFGPLSLMQRLPKLTPERAASVYGVKIGNAQ
jgi:hypothetical protein